MYFDNHDNKYSTEINGYKLYEHKINALLKYSLNEVFSNDVHHINHVGFDNRPNNLIILSHGEHSKLHQTGNKLSESTKHKLKLSHLGKLPWNTGKKCPQIAVTKLGSKNPMWKSYPRIVSKGLADNGKPRWVIVYNNKQIKSSVNLDKLIKYFEETFKCTWIA